MSDQESGKPAMNAQRLSPLPLEVRTEAAHRCAACRESHGGQCIDELWASDPGCRLGEYLPREEADT